MLLYYLYLVYVNLFKELFLFVYFRFESGCKGKHFIFNHQIISKVFSKIILKPKTVLPAKRSAKIILLKPNLQIIQEIYFQKITDQNRPRSQHVKLLTPRFSYKAGAKVQDFHIQSKYLCLLFYKQTHFLY